MNRFSILAVNRAEADAKKHPYVKPSATKPVAKKLPPPEGPRVSVFRGQSSTKAKAPIAPERAPDSPSNPMTAKTVDAPKDRPLSERPAPAPAPEDPHAGKPTRADLFREANGEFSAYAALLVKHGYEKEKSP